MRVVEQFFDSNILLYLLSGDDAKADKAEEVSSQGGHISVQVLNEFASIATRKLKLTHVEIREILAPVRAICNVNPLTEEIHDLGLHLSERYQLSIYDAMIAASALAEVARRCSPKTCRMAKSLIASFELETRLRVNHERAVQNAPHMV